MKNFFASIRQLWQEAQNRRRYAAIIDPTCIGNMAKELTQLVQMSLRWGQISNEEAQYLQQLQIEMERLITLTQQSAFSKLPAYRRVTLYHSIQRSHEKLIDSMQNTDAPTTRIQ